MSNLYHCNFCGKNEGYTLQNGDTYRWWNVICKVCGEMVAVCHSDLRADLKTELPDTWTNADASWNESTAYAYGLLCSVKQLESEKELVNAELTALKLSLIHI